MTVEQWGFVALVILLPVLQGVAWLRRMRVDHEVRPGDRVAAPRAARARVALPNRNAGETAMGAAETLAVASLPLSRPPSLPPASDSPASLAARRASRRPVPEWSHSLQAHRPLSDTAVAHWLRSTRNLRRAIVAAAILGPPPAVTRSHAR